MSDVDIAVEHLDPNEGDRSEQHYSVRMATVTLLPHHQVTPPATPPPDVRSSAGAVESELCSELKEPGAGEAVEKDATAQKDPDVSPTAETDPSGQQKEGYIGIGTELPSHDDRATSEQRHGQEPQQRDGAGREEVSDGRPEQGEGAERRQNGIGPQIDRINEPATELERSPDTTIDEAPPSTRNTPILCRPAPPSAHPSPGRAFRGSYSDVWERLRPLVSSTSQTSSPTVSSPMAPGANIPVRQVSESPEPDPAPAKIGPTLEIVDVPHDLELLPVEETLAQEPPSPAQLPPQLPPQLPIGTTQPNTGVRERGSSARIPAPFRPAIRILRKLLDERQLTALMEEGTWEPLFITNFARIMDAWHSELEGLRSATFRPSAPAELMVKEQEIQNFIAHCQVRYPGQLMGSLRPNGAVLSRSVTAPHPDTAPPTMSTFGFGNAIPAASGNRSPPRPLPIQRPVSQPFGPSLMANGLASPVTRQVVYHYTRPPMAGFPIDTQSAYQNGTAPLSNPPLYGTGLSQGRLVQPGQPTHPAANWNLPPNQQMVMMLPPVPQSPQQSIPHAQPSPSSAGPVPIPNPQDQANSSVAHPASAVRPPADHAWDLHVSRISVNLQAAWNTIQHGHGEYAKTMQETVADLENRLATATARSNHYKQKAGSVEGQIQAARQKVLSAEAQLTLARLESTSHKQRWAQAASAELSARVELDSLKAQYERLAAANRDANDNKERLQVDNERLKAGRDVAEAQRVAAIIERSTQKHAEAISRLKEEHAADIKSMKDQQAAHIRSNNLKMAELEKEKADEIARIRVAQEAAINEAATRDGGRVRKLEKFVAQLKEDLEVAQGASADMAAMKAHAAREIEWIRQKEMLEAEIAKLSMTNVSLESRLSTLQSDFERLSGELEEARRAVAAKHVELTGLEESSAVTIEETEANAKRQYDEIADQVERLQAALTKASTSEAILRQNEADLLDEKGKLVEGVLGQIKEKEKEVSDLQSQLEISDAAHLNSKAKERALAKVKKVLEEDKQRLEKEVERLLLFSNTTESKTAGSAPPPSQQPKRNAFDNGSGNATVSSSSAPARPLARPFVAPAPVPAGPAGPAGPSKKRDRSPIKPTIRDAEALFTPRLQAESPVLKKPKLEPAPLRSHTDTPSSVLEPVSVEWIRAHLRINVMEVHNEHQVPYKVVCKICHVDAKKVIKRRLAQQGATKPEQEERAAMEVGKVAQQKGLLGVQSRALHEAEIIRHLDENHQSTMIRLKAQRDSQGKAPPTGSPSNGRAYQSRRETDSV